MLMEVDQVAVSEDLWLRVQEGDEDARNKLRLEVNGLDIYMHAMPVAVNKIIVSLRQLEAMNVVESVKITALRG